MLEYVVLLLKDLHLENIPVVIGNFFRDIFAAITSFRLIDVYWWIRGLIVGIYWNNVTLIILVGFVVVVVLMLRSIASNRS